MAARKRKFDGPTASVVHHIVVQSLVYPSKQGVLIAESKPSVAPNFAANVQSKTSGST